MLQLVGSCWRSQSESRQENINKKKKQQQLSHVQKGIPDTFYPKQQCT